MNQNVRISLYIIVPIIFWMLSGIFVEQKEAEIDDQNPFYIDRGKREYSSIL